MRTPAADPRGARGRDLRGVGALGTSALACVLLALVALPAAALDFLDGRVQIHGFYEQDIRSLWQNLSPSNRWDLSQWQHILDLESDVAIAPDGWGPFDSVSGFTRVEVRFDCIWTRGCGLFSHADVYGDRSSTGTLPDRVANGRRSGYTGTQFTGDQDPYLYQTVFDLQKGHFGGGTEGRPRAVLIWNLSSIGVPFTGGLGPDGVRGTFQNPGDDPSWPLYAHFLGKDGEKCLFTTRKLKAGNAAGFGVRDMPWNPGCDIQPTALLRSYPNPWNPSDPNLPVLGAFAQANPGVQPVGTGGLPYRPAPLLPAASSGNRRLTQAQGLYYPTPVFAQRMANREFGAFDQNYSQSELQWNHGASQSETYELKEAYLDLEAFDSRLWVRLGKQEIVWGKTELFRNQDRFNPQDLALSTLPTLEESRIPLWALRAVWSFYRVGPLDDVRLEGALDLNQFQPNDLGRCGEPYTVLLVCDKTFGLMAHGITGLGLEGEIRPPKPWEDVRGLEGGTRLEWRYDRFSFALTDYYGYSQLPIAPADFHYARNVDPVSGRPRIAGSNGPCPTGTEAACLTPANALTLQPANQELYAWLCANTVGLVAGAVPGVPVTDCPLVGLFNSKTALPPPSPAGVSFGFALNAMMAGNAFGRTIWSTLSQCGASCAAAITSRLAVPASEQGGTPLVDLSIDANNTIPANSVPALVRPGGLDYPLTPQQQALLGCGQFYGRDCDSGQELDRQTGAIVPGGTTFAPGIDLLNSEASVLLQSFDTIDGTLGVGWSTLDKTRWQPGTVGFQGGPVATRPGQASQLPGSRGQGLAGVIPPDPGYDPAVDGTTTGNSTSGAHTRRAQPFTGQFFRSEMAVLSWNLEMMLAALQADPTGKDPRSFDPSHPFAAGRCSLAQPQFCLAVAGFVGEAAATRPTVLAGGNGRYGRRDFLWQSGYELLLRYPKTNVLGFSTDFAEDRTKTNWGIEFTWENNLPVSNLFSPDQTTDTDLFNLTISVDRPTFINFLNANRTFFMNSQLFVQYVSNYQKGFQMEGPYNFLWTITVSTGYFQDRLLPSMTLVWDLNSNSGAFLPQAAYRFTENFSAVFGVSVFGGRWSRKNGGISDTLDPIATGPASASTYVQNGISPVQDRDELFVKLRYTF